MSVLDKILDLGVKYGPEVSQYFSGQKRISKAIEDQRRENLPEFGRRSATSAEQALSNLVNRDTFAGQKEEARRQTAAALDRMKGQKGGGAGNLAEIIRASGDVQRDLGEAQLTQKRATAQAAAPLERSIQDYNMKLDDQEKVYDLMKERQINALEDQSQRMKGRGARTLFDIIGDSRGLLSDLKGIQEIDQPEDEFEDEGDSASNIAGMNLNPSNYQGLLLPSLAKNKYQGLLLPSLANTKRGRNGLNLLKLLGGNNG